MYECNKIVNQWRGGTKNSRIATSVFGKLNSYLHLVHDIDNSKKLNNVFHLYKKRIFFN